VHQRRRLPRCNVCRTRWLVWCKNQFVVLQQPRRTHAEPLLWPLHWLPVKHRVTYKLAVLTFTVQLTAYLNSLISNRVTVSRMSLRSSTRSLMAVPRTNTVCASRSFSVCAPVVWNSLPPDIQLCSCLKTFKLKLKTFLFCWAFDIWPVTKRLCILDFMALYNWFYLLAYLLPVTLTFNSDVFAPQQWNNLLCKL